MEWFPDWDSGFLDTFSDTIQVPARTLEQGSTYRARVRHKDNTGRWSHWSAPVEIIPGAPATISELQRNLAITEIHYAPSAPTAAENANWFLQL